jgi:hypothetical protein
MPSVQNILVRVGIPVSGPPAAFSVSSARAQQRARFLGNGLKAFGAPLSRAILASRSRVS